MYRLPGHDYAEPGAYFATICLDQRHELLSSVDSSSRLHLSSVGRMVERTILEMPRKFPDVALDAFVVMPDHLHVLIFVGIDPESTRSTSLVDLMRWFKSVSAKRYGEGVRAHGWPPYRRALWQRHYYDRVIRSDRELNQIRQYIATNPARWAEKRSGQMHPPDFVGDD